MNFSLFEFHNYKDHRGNLIEFISEHFLREKALSFGQIYTVTFEDKNAVRGNHYHKNSTEVFCVIFGEVEIIVEDIEKKERFSRIFSAFDSPVTGIIIGPCLAHSIRSLTDNALVISFSSKVFDPHDKFYYLLQ